MAITCDYVIMYLQKAFQYFPHSKYCIKEVGVTEPVQTNVCTVHVHE